MVSGAEPSVDRAARERRFQKSCAGAEPFHRHLETPSGIVVIKAGGILADQYPLDGVRDQRQVVHGVEARRLVTAGVVGVGTATVLRRAPDQISVGVNPGQP